MSKGKKKGVAFDEKCRDCVITERKFPGYGYRCRKFPACGYPHHPGGCPCGCKTP